MASAFSAKPTSASTACAAPSKPWSPTALRRPSKPRARNSGSATSTFSSAVNSSNSVMIWNERASPRAAIACGKAGHVLAGDADRAAGGLHAAGQDVEEGRLAGAVRAHDAVQLAGLDRKRDVLEHDAVAEADMDVAGVEHRHRG